MSNRIAIGISIVLSVLHVSTAKKIHLQSIENENLQSIRIVTNGINAFSTHFYQAISKNEPEENMVCSTMSIAMVLTMAAYGAGGKTREELNKVLHINTDENIQKNGIHFLMKQLNAAKKVELRLANNIYVKNGLKIKPDFKIMSDTIFQSGIENLDFSNSVAASEEINGWCEKQTNSRIKNIVKPDDFDDRTALVLVNAVYFKGNWAKKFIKNDTELRNFYRSDNTTKKVPMMHNVGKYRYGELPQLSARFIELPYESTDINDAMSMIILLPYKINGLEMVEKNLHKMNLTQLLMGNQYEVDLFIPKFKIESKLDVKATLSVLGMVEIFGNNANFTGISDQLPLKVTKIMQKAFIEVNEEGSEAAAVTEIELENRIGYDDVIKQTFFHVDRPFLTLIVTEDVILFSCHVVDPTSL